MAKKFIRPDGSEVHDWGEPKNIPKFLEKHDYARADELTPADRKKVEYPPQPTHRTLDERFNTLVTLLERHLNLPNGTLHQELREELSK